MQSIDVIKYQYLWPTRPYGWFSAPRVVTPINEFDSLADASSYSFLGVLVSPDGDGLADSISFGSAILVADLVAEAGSSSTGLSGSDGGEQGIDSPGVSVSTAWATIVAELAADAGSSSVGGSGTDGIDQGVDSPGVSVSTTWAELVADLTADAGSSSAGGSDTDGGDANINSPGVSVSTVWAELVADLTADAGSSSSGGSDTDGGDANIDSPGVSVSTVWAELVADLTADAASSSSGGSDTDGGDANIDSPCVSTSTAWAQLVADLTADASSSSSGGSDTDGGDANIGSPGVSVSTVWAQLVADLTADANSSSVGGSDTDGGDANIDSPGVSVSTVWAELVADLNADAGSSSGGDGLSDGGDASIDSPGVSVSTVWAQLVADLNAAAGSSSNSGSDTDGGNQNIDSPGVSVSTVWAQLVADLNAAAGSSSVGDGLSDGGDANIDSPGVSISTVWATIVPDLNAATSSFSTGSNDTETESSQDATSSSTAWGIINSVELPVAAQINSTSALSATSTATIGSEQTVTADQIASTSAVTATNTNAVTQSVTADQITSTSAVSANTTSSSAVTLPVTANQITSTSAVSASATSSSAVTVPVTADQITSTSAVSATATNAVTQAVTGSVASMSTVTAVTSESIIFSVDAEAYSASSGTASCVVEPPPLPSVTGWASASGNTVAIPAHKAGDLILVWAGSRGTTTTAVVAPAAPAAGGTVPAFVTLSAVASTVNASGPISCGQRWSYAKATSSNHTLGAWGTANQITVAVITDVADQPIGAYREVTSTASYGRTATFVVHTPPALTLTSPNNTSIVIKSARSTHTGITSMNFSARTGYSLVPATGIIGGAAGATSAFGSVIKDEAFDAPAEQAITTSVAVATSGQASMKLSSIEILGRRVSNDSLYEINTAGLASPISIPLDSTRIDLGAVGGGAGGGGGALIANGHAGGGGVWDYGSFTLAELYAGAGVVASNVTAVNAICTVGAGGAGGPGSLIGSGPDGSNVPGQGRNGTATTISIVATMSSGGTVTLKTLSGAGGRITLNPIFAPLRGFAVTGGNQDSFTLFGGGAESVVEPGRDVIFGGQTWRGGRTSDVGSPALGAGKSPGGGGAGGGVPSLGGSRGADGGARVRVYGALTREDRDHLPGQDSNDILPELVDPSTPVGIVRTINDDGETLYDGMTMAEIEALIERLVDERVAATVAAADAKAFEYTRQRVQEVLDAMNGPDATVDSVQDMFWLLNDLIEALMNATGVQPSS